MNDKHVEFPQFELVGLPCETSECKGVLTDHVSLKTQEFFRRCSVCNQEFHRMAASEKMKWVERVLERVLKGEKDE